VSSCTSFFLLHSLAGNRIGAEGAVAIGEALKCNKTITTLECGGGNASRLLSSVYPRLSYNLLLLYISIIGNGIGDEGAAAIGEVLKRNKTITKLG
jgi:hypothetical protein